ncbi:unnamed protein product, partial [Mycena citricolor]
DPEATSEFDCSSLGLFVACDVSIKYLQTGTMGSGLARCAPEPVSFRCFFECRSMRIHMMGTVAEMLRGAQSDSG